METEKRKKGWTVSFVCAAAGSVAEKNGTKPRRQENGNRQGQEILCRIWGRETGALKYREFQVQKTERLHGDPVRRTGDGTALSDFFDDQEVMSH